MAEAPEDDRNTHYLGREYLFYGRWDDCIRTLERHLSLPTAVWADERCASMRFLARAWRQKGRPEQARRWLWRAIGEAPHLREPYLELARLLYEEAEWDGVVYLCRQALAITDRPQTYICEAEAWGSLPWDLLSLGLYHTGRRAEALEAARQAGRPVFTFSQRDPQADIYASQVRKEDGQTVFHVRTPQYEREFRLTMPGLFNVENALGVIAVCHALHVSPAAVYDGLVRARVPGRMETYANANGSLHAIVDLSLIHI